MPFDPTKHMTNLKGKDYLETKWRLVWLRTDAPDAHITTELLRETETSALFKASVVIPGKGSATGHGSETKPDFGDFIEKAETKAIGRALAALGYGTQFADDFEDSGAVADSPVERKPAAARPPATPARPAGTPIQRDPGPTQAQKDRLRDAFMRSGWTVADTTKVLTELYGKRQSADLTGAESDEFADLLDDKRQLVYDGDGKARAVVIGEPVATA